MSQGKCSKCEVVLTPDNATKYIIDRGCGFCLKCKKIYAADYQQENKEYRASYQKERSNTIGPDYCKNHPQETRPCKICTNYVKNVRRERAEKGVCINHPDRLPVPGKLSCFECLLYRRLRSLPEHAREKASDAVHKFNGRCDCCGESTPGWGRSEWCLDHNHITGDFRGILCFNCNTALGYVKDSIGRLNMLFKYLEGAQNGASVAGL